MFSELFFDFGESEKCLNLKIAFPRYVKSIIKINSFTVSHCKNHETNSFIDVFTERGNSYFLNSSIFEGAT